MARSEASLAEAARYVEERDRIAWTTARQLRFLWLDMAARSSFADAAERFGKLAPPLLYAGQDAAVRSSDVFLARYLSLETEQRVAALGIDPTEFRGLAGTSAPATAAFAAAVSRSVSYSLGVGLGSELAAANAGVAVARLARTEVRVSARAAVLAVADGREFAGRPKITGYQRITTGSSSCLACLSAAGQTFATGETFKYHPGCGCSVVPVVADAPNRVHPPTGRELFDRMSRDKQDRVFGEQAAQLIRGGAPLDDFATHDGRYFVQATVKEATT